MPFNIQGPEIIILLVIALLVLGPGKLPEVGSALGKSIREFRKAASDVKESVNVEPVPNQLGRADAPAPVPNEITSVVPPSSAGAPAPVPATPESSAPASPSDPETPAS